MKKNNFQSYLEKRLTKSEISQIEHQAKLEMRALQDMQKAIAEAVDKYMKKENIGFNELVRRLHSSPTHVAKIQKGESNLTLSSIARLFALLEQHPQLVFSQKK